MKSVAVDTSDNKNPKPDKKCGCSKSKDENLEIGTTRSNADGHSSKHEAGPSASEVESGKKN